MDATTSCSRKNEVKKAPPSGSPERLIGEYMPKSHAAARQSASPWISRKRQPAHFRALDVRDYARAETLVNDLEKLARTDASTRHREPPALWRHAPGQGKNAAVSGDRATLETELRGRPPSGRAPQPGSGRVSGLIFSQADAGKAIADLNFLASTNYRQISTIKCAILPPNRLSRPAERIEKVLETMTQIETTIGRSTELNVGQPGGRMGRGWSEYAVPGRYQLNNCGANYASESADC